jgi:tRNA G18 (ribose-2'-O)-methylase SpoU
MSSVALFHVDDPDDPRIADYHAVPEPELLVRKRIFIAEGRLVVRRLLHTKRLVTRSLLVTEAALHALHNEIDINPLLPVFVAPQAVMNRVAGFDIHRGCLAIGERGIAADWRDVAATARRLVILERVGNADNVGGAFRNAAAFAADGVLLGPETVDPLYRKAIRTSMGAALNVPFAHLAEGQQSSWPQPLHCLRATGVLVVGLTPRADARPLRAVAREHARARVAIVAGHEGEGLTRDAMDACDVLARIPMTPAVDSLNVATAIGIALYDFHHDSTDTPEE